MASPPHSPPCLHGASRTTGGILRGQALGNVVTFSISATYTCYLLGTYFSPHFGFILTNSSLRNGRYHASCNLGILC